MNRRKFLESAAASTCFTILPRHVLGGSGVVPPSDKITLAYIGTGTEGLREMPRLMAIPEIRDLREIHNWTNRPVWPQYSNLPTATTPVPEGVDWDLWLGPEAERPYSPEYTQMVFRGWYDFGGGSMADMGHYSLWTVFKALELGSPTSVEPTLTHTCGLKDGIAFQVENDFSFPTACTVRFKYPASGKRPAVDLVH
jgi:hypothetical protein